MDSSTTSIPQNASQAIAATGPGLSGNAATSVAATNAANAARAVDRQQSATKAEVQKQDSSLQRDPRSLQFQVDGNRVITTIIDENNKTVVVQIPDADMIRIAKAIDRMQGFLVKDKA